MSFFFQPSRAHRDLHSFPTRRSSDLRSDHGRDVFRDRPQASLDARPVAVRGPRLWQLLRGTDRVRGEDRKSTRLNSSHVSISYAVFCLKKKKTRSDTLVDRTRSHPAV